MTNQGTNPGSARSKASDSRDLGHATDAAIDFLTISPFQAR
jgi:hypothetical protein